MQVKKVDVRSAPEMTEAARDVHKGCAPETAKKAHHKADEDAVTVKIRGALSAKKLERIDADGSGTLEMSELENALGTLGGKQPKFVNELIDNYERLDRNGDGSLGIEEARRCLVARLKKHRHSDEGDDNSEVTPTEPPVEETPGGDVQPPASEPPPVDSTPVETPPVDTTPVDSTPVDAGPGDTTPVDSTPVDSTPVDSTPVDSTPVDSGPGDTTAGGDITTGGGIVTEPPADGSSASGTSGAVPGTSTEGTEPAPAPTDGAADPVIPVPVPPVTEPTLSDLLPENDKPADSVPA